MPYTYTLLPAYAATYTGGVIRVTDQRAYDVGAALTAGSGTITVPDTDPELAVALDQYPPLQRTGGPPVPTMPTRPGQYRGLWQPSTYYGLNDRIRRPDTGGMADALVEHVSGLTFDTADWRDAPATLSTTRIAQAADGTWPDPPEGAGSSVTYVGPGSMHTAATARDPSPREPGAEWDNTYDGVRYIADGVAWGTKPTTLAKPARLAVDIPFRADSVWNTPAVAAPGVLPTGGRATRLLRSARVQEAGIDSGAIPITVNFERYFGFMKGTFDQAGVNDPVTTFEDEGHGAQINFSIGGKLGIRCPVDAMPSVGTDASITVVMPDGVTSYVMQKQIRTGPTRFRTIRTVSGAQGAGTGSGFDCQFTAGQADIVRAYTPRTVGAGGAAANVLPDTAHIVDTGTPLVFSAGAPPELTPGVTYYGIRVDADHFSVADTLAHALAGTALVLTAASGAGASYAFGVGAQISLDWLRPNAGGNAYPDNPNLDPLGGFQRGITYYCVASDLAAGAGKFQLSLTPGGPAIVPTANGFMSIDPISARATTTGVAISKARIDGTGIGGKGRASGFHQLAGAIRGFELEQGRIDHALMLVLAGKWKLRQNGPTPAPGSVNTGWVYPASAQDAPGIYGWTTVALTGNVGAQTHTRANLKLDVGDTVKATSNGAGLTSGQTYWVATSNGTDTVTLVDQTGAAVTVVAGTVNVTIYGSVPVGAMVMLPSSFDEQTQMATDTGRTIAQCLKTRGAFVGDNAGGDGLVIADDVPVERWLDLRANNWQELVTLRANFVIVDPLTVSPASPNGGPLGAARAAGFLPPLRGEV